jgi:vacuolar-type H+-ATPase subunit H
VKEYIERRFNDQQRAIEAALSAAEKAVTKAEVATEKRFDSVNEFRKTLSDQAANFLQRGEYYAQHKALEEKVGAIGKMQNMMIGAFVILSFLEPIIIAVVRGWGK